MKIDLRIADYCSIMSHTLFNCIGGKNEEEDAEEGGAESLNYEEISASMDVVCKKLAEELATLKVNPFIRSVFKQIFKNTSCN